MGAVEDQREGGASAEAASPLTSVAGFIYVVTNEVNGKEYVGQTRSSLSHRWSQHVLKARKGRSALQCAIRKYGAEAFRIELLEVIRGSRDELLRAEIDYIARRDSMAPRGYNLMPGGEGVDLQDPIIKATHLDAVRASHGSEWRARQYQGAQKRLADPEWRRLNEQALRESHARPEYREKVTARWRAFFASSDGRQRHAAGVARRSEGSWKQNHRAAMLRLHQDPVYVAKRDAALKAAAERRSRDAIERDKALPPEIVAKRVQNREACRKRAAARRARSAGE